MSKYLKFLFIFFSLSLCTFSISANAQTADVYILAGQSNMMGTGNSESDLPSYLQAPQNDLFITGKFLGEPNWSVVDAPNTGSYGDYVVSTGKLEFQGFGPELTFARRVADHTGRQVFILKWAIGGHNLQNDFLGKEGKTQGVLYPDLVQKKSQFEARLMEQFGLTADYKAFLWMQGESDATPGRSYNYEDNLDELITSLRQDFEANLPVVIGRISDWQNTGDWNRVRDAQVNWAEANSNAWWFNTDDIAVRPGDEVHYSAQGYLDLGNRFANTYINNVLDGPGNDNPPVAEDINFANPQVSSLDLSGNISVPISYSAAQNRDLVLEIFDANWNWLGQKKQNISSGSATTTVTANIGAIPAGDYQIKIGLRPVNGDYTQSLIDRYQTNVPAAASGSVNTLSYNAAPTQIDVSGNLTISTNYETTANRVIVAEIFDINWNWLGWNIQNVSAGSGTSTHNLSVGPLAAGEYRLKISLRDVANDVNTTVLDRYTTTTAVDNANYADDLLTVNAPNAFTAGQGSAVTVDYTASEDREVLVIMANGDDGWSWQAFERKAVSAGQGTVSVTVNMSASADAGSNYKLQVILVPVGGVLDDALDEIATSGNVVQ